MDANQVIELARQHMGKNSSARLALMDAMTLNDKGRCSDAKKRALDSLKHSVGIFHDDYRKASI